jgi:hypothetical protein
MRVVTPLYIDTVKFGLESNIFVALLDTSLSSRWKVKPPLVWPNDLPSPNQKINIRDPTLVGCRLHQLPRVMLFLSIRTHRS